MSMLQPFAFTVCSSRCVCQVVLSVHPSVAKMTIFIVIHGPGCVGSEVADFAHFPLILGCLDAVLLIGSGSL